MKELALPGVRQVTNFSCGAAALASVLRYLGKDVCECKVMSLAGTNDDDGTSPSGIIKAADRLGVEAIRKDRASLEDVCEAVRAGRPVMVSLQAWAEGGRPPGRLGYFGKWEDGHWVVVTAVSTRRLVFMDPSLPNARATLSHSEFLRRWHDKEIDGKIERLAIIFPAPEEPVLKSIGRVVRMG